MFSRFFSETCTKGIFENISRQVILCLVKISTKTLAEKTFREYLIKIHSGKKNIYKKVRLVVNQIPPSLEVPLRI